jgi:protein-L-isoaspartate O-methyltransferase
MLVSGDGRKGYPSEGPYDAIHVGAAAPNLPEPVSFKYCLRIGLVYGV